MVGCKTTEVMLYYVSFNGVTDMNNGFKLTASQITPPQGELLGIDLRNLAEDILARGSNPLNNRRAQVLFLLAADAYDLGAAASIGHNRADRYTLAAKELRARAEQLKIEEA